VVLFDESKFLFGNGSKSWVATNNVNKLFILGLFFLWQQQVPGLCEFFK
jgi:hypothetical protein